MGKRVWWQIARIPVLLTLLAGVGQFQVPLAWAWRQADVEQATAPWAAMVLLAAAFVTVALLARASGIGRALAAIEVLLAGVITVVPPMQWLLWFGFNWFTEWIGTTTGNAFAQGLAVAWLVIAARALVSRGGEPSGGTSGSGSVAEEPGAAR